MNQKHSKSNKDTLEDLRQKKNQLNKKARQTDSTEEDKIEANETVRLYNHMLKLNNEKDLAKRTKKRREILPKRFLENCKVCDRRHIW